MKCCFGISSTISVDGSDFQGEALFRLGEVSHMCSCVCFCSVYPSPVVLIGFIGQERHRA